MISRSFDDWTLEKLEFLKRYLCAFTTASKDRGLNAAYIDAFSGAKYCSDDLSDPSRLAGFAELANESPQALLKYSVRTALTADPAFDGYVFIERDRRRCQVLEALRHEFAHRNIQIRRIDANRELRRISHLNWHMRRAVLIVDAYAANLEWETISAVSRTNAIDVWLLFPVGIDSYQPRGNAVPFPSLWGDRLNVLLQTDEWLTDGQASLSPLDGLVDTLGRRFTDRLKATFANVSSPRIMRSASGAPLYVHCFATGVPGIEGRAAVELADHLLESI